MRILACLLVVACACGSASDPREGRTSVASAGGGPPAATPRDAVIADAPPPVDAAAPDAAAPEAHRDPGCPEAKPSTGDTCGAKGTSTRLRCDYAAQTCECHNAQETWCSGVNPGLMPPTWTCAARARADGCPVLAPTKTTAGKPACDTPGQRCSYHAHCCDGTFTCTAGQWTGTLRCLNVFP